jgi:hypothetical protein
MGGQVIEEPFAHKRARLLDDICRRWPGYTLSSALKENSELLWGTYNLVNDG